MRGVRLLSKFLDCPLLDEIVEPAPTYPFDMIAFSIISRFLTLLAL